MKIMADIKKGKSKTWDTAVRAAKMLPGFVGWVNCGIFYLFFSFHLFSSVYSNRVSAQDRQVVQAKPFVPTSIDKESNPAGFQNYAKHVNDCIRQGQTVSGKRNRMWSRRARVIFAHNSLFRFELVSIFLHRMLPHAIRAICATPADISLREHLRTMTAKLCERRKYSAILHKSQMRGLHAPEWDSDWHMYKLILIWFRVAAINQPAS